jgi:hypothetical protein
MSIQPRKIHNSLRPMPQRTSWDHHYSMKHSISLLYLTRFLFRSNPTIDKSRERQLNSYKHTQTQTYISISHQLWDVRCQTANYFHLVTLCPCVEMVPMMWVHWKQHMLEFHSRLLMRLWLVHLHRVHQQLNVSQRLFGKLFSWARMSISHYASNRNVLFSREGRAGKFELTIEHWFIRWINLSSSFSALITSFGVVKYMVAYSLTQFLTVIMLYTVQIAFSFYRTLLCDVKSNRF